MLARTALYVAVGVAAAGTLLVPCPATPQGSRVSATRANASVQIDGRLDEAVWRAVKPSTQFVQREPIEGAPATMATDVRVLITDDAVIVGATLRDDKSNLRGSLGPPGD